MHDPYDKSPNPVPKGFEQQSDRMSHFLKHGIKIILLKSIYRMQSLHAKDTTEWFLNNNTEKFNSL